METLKNTISGSVAKRIKSIPEGKIFSYDDFKLSEANKLALAQSLSRLTKNGIINRITKGKYYKPKKSIFGQLKPSENEVIKALTTKDKKITGYVTGLILFNGLGLTTQVPNIIIIATNNVLPKKKIGVYQIKYIKQKASITKNTIPLLQLLDAIKAIKKIPDTEVNTTFKLLLKEIKQLDNAKKVALLKEAEKYNPATRALIGALYEKYLPEYNYAALKRTLNPLSTYEIDISLKNLPNKINWNIK